MARSKFMTDLLSKEKWQSSGGSTVRNPQYNDYPELDWRRDLILDKESYYPPEDVVIKIVDFPIIREAYLAKHKGTEVPIPRVELEAFKMEIEGDDFAGKKALKSARFIVSNDHAISSPIIVDPGLSVVVLVRLRELDSGRLIMVNELIWSVQKESEEVGSKSFYDIQKWYCCGYP